MFGINWKIYRLRDENLYGIQRYDTFLDFGSKQEVKEFVEKELNKIFCSSCGGQRIRANNIKVNVKKIYFYKQELRDGLFGKKKHVDILDKVKWRVEGADFGDGGFIRCKTCKQESYTFPTLKFLSVPLSSPKSILRIIKEMPRQERNNFVTDKLIRESIERPVKMKRLLDLCQKNIDDYHKNDNYDESRKYNKILNDLGQVAASVMKL